MFICYPTPPTGRDMTSQRWSEIRKSTLILPKYHQNQWENVQTIRFELRKNLRFALWIFFHTFILEIWASYFRNPSIICDDLAKKYLNDHNSPKTLFPVILVGVPTKNRSPKSSTAKIPLQFWMSPDRNREKIWKNVGGLLKVFFCKIIFINRALCKISRLGQIVAAKKIHNKIISSRQTIHYFTASRWSGRLHSGGQIVITKSRSVSRRGRNVTCSGGVTCSEGVTFPHFFRPPLPPIGFLAPFCGAGVVSPLRDISAPIHAS